MNGRIDYHEVETLTVWLDGKEQLCSVDEQSARNDRWFDTPWWRALLPGDLVR